MRPVTVAARDGLPLVCYLTRPVAGAGAGNDGADPLVLLVHGGPWGRDQWGFHPLHQWLADRGYAVLSVNFRGSTGFGKAFVNAGDREWGAKMQDDLHDAVAWAVREGVADPERVAIMGGSYGGYAALAGLTFTPEAFACGVDIVGPSNLVTMVETIPPYWRSLIEVDAKRVGDSRTEEGRAFLWSRSPLASADRIRRPLLIAHGANDPRVARAESDEIVGAMGANGVPVTYVVFPDEGHGFVRPPNRLAFRAVTEAFLGAVLGGRVQPIGEDLAGSSITVPVGAELIGGLQEALARQG
jgi:dipeptidyl aminopeptidase/acylaminoacyl peptidase